MNDIKYYYQTYRHSHNSHFKIKITEIGHIVIDEKILCGEQMGDKNTFTSYKIISASFPGRRLCEKCVQKRSNITNQITYTDNEKLKKWIEASTRANHTNLKKG